MVEQPRMNYPSMNYPWTPLKSTVAFLRRNAQDISAASMCTYLSNIRASGLQMIIPGSMASRLSVFAGGIPYNYVT